jgi:hypothetical protein
VAAPLIARTAWAEPVYVEEETPRCGQATEPSRNDHVHPTIPPGTIQPFAGHHVPEGWLPCDGRAVGVKEYPALFAAIGTAYGAVDTSYRFKLPDMRGYITGSNASYNANHSHGIIEGPPPNGHAHTISQADHSHSMLWFQPTGYLIKT